MTRPLQGEDLVERAHSGFELFNTTSGALIFIADKNGSILLHTGTRPSPARMCRPITLHSLMKAAIFRDRYAGRRVQRKYYTAGRRITVGGQDGYLFAASPMNA